MKKTLKVREKPGRWRTPAATTLPASTSTSRMHSVRTWIEYEIIPAVESSKEGTQKIV